MTNAQRDELLISLVTRMDALNNKMDNLNVSLNKKIDDVKDELTEIIEININAAVEVIQESKEFRGYIIERVQRLESQI